MSSSYSQSSPPPIAVGISSCLTGERVRYDGGHKQSTAVTDCLRHCFRLVPLCPETGCGMPTPREAMRLENHPDAPRLVTRYSQIDLTSQMLEWSRMKVQELEYEKLCGFIFKRNSPSCGLLRVAVHCCDRTVREGRGLFASAIVQQFPRLPVVEEDRLENPCFREEFIEQVYSYWQTERA